jgi:hypothetical protein
MEMKCIFTSIFLAACGFAVVAQTSKLLQQLTIAETSDLWIGRVETLVVAGADSMPVSKYSFAPPTTMGNFAGARTFAQQVKHLSANNYRMAVILLQKPSTEVENETWPDSVMTKREIMEYLKDSFAALHKAVLTINAQNTECC